MGVIVDFLALRETERQAIELFDCGETSITDYFRQEVASLQDDRRLLVYLEDGRVAGFVSIALGNFKVSIQNHQPVEMNPIVYVHALGVDKDFQGKTIGSQLLAAVFSIALLIDNQLPIKGVRLMSLRDATDFYEKFGFIYLTRSPDEDLLSQEFYMYLTMSYIRQLDMN